MECQLLRRYFAHTIYLVHTIAEDRSGCLIVELLDYRPPNPKDKQLEEPQRTRVVLHPNSDTLYADIRLLKQKSGRNWTDAEALDIESRLLVSF